MGTARTGARSATSCSASTATLSTPSTRRLTTPGANDAALKKVSACTGPLATQARCALRAGPLALQALAARGWVRLPSKLGCTRLGPLAPQAWPHAAGSACHTSLVRTACGSACPTSLAARGWVRLPCKLRPHAVGSACPASCVAATRLGPLALQASLPPLPACRHRPMAPTAATWRCLGRGFHTGGQR